MRFSSGQSAGIRLWKELNGSPDFAPNAEVSENAVKKPSRHHVPCHGPIRYGDDQILGFFEVLSGASDLLPSERRLVAAMQRLGFGRFESMRIKRGELVLDPWPTTVKVVKFGPREARSQTPSDTFELKRNVVQLFDYVRSIDDGSIRSLDVKHGLPLGLEIEQRPELGLDRGGA
jgi:hypothetical protein